jgi:hypothetical protein
MVVSIDGFLAVVGALCIDVFSNAHGPIIAAKNDHRQIDVRSPHGFENSNVPVL